MRTLRDLLALTGSAVFLLACGATSYNTCEAKAQAGCIDELDVYECSEKFDCYEALDEKCGEKLSAWRTCEWIQDDCADHCRDERDAFVGCVGEERAKTCLGTDAYSPF